MDLIILRDQRQVRATVTDIQRGVYDRKDSGHVVIDGQRVHVYRPGKERHVWHEVVYVSDDLGEW